MDRKSVKPLEELLDSVRDIDGFPIAEDEDILALSDPPFYTTCPNPYIKEFIEEYGFEGSISLLNQSEEIDRQSKERAEKEMEEFHENKKKYSVHTSRGWGNQVKRCI